MHKTLTTIVDAQGTEHDILRDNMPFGSPGRGEFGTDFIGYTRNLWVIEKMLANMLEGVAAGRYDRAIGFFDADDRARRSLLPLFDAQKSWLSEDRCPEPQQTFNSVQPARLLKRRQAA